MLTFSIKYIEEEKKRRDQEIEKLNPDQNKNKGDIKMKLLCTFGEVLGDYEWVEKNEIMLKKTDGEFVEFFRLVKNHYNGKIELYQCIENEWKFIKTENYKPRDLEFIFSAIKVINGGENEK